MQHNLEDPLTMIQKCYTQIFQITETLDINGTAEAWHGVLDKRAAYFSTIAKEMESLHSMDGSWQDHCIREASLNNLLKEIQTLQLAIIALDTMFQDRMKACIDDVQNRIRVVNTQNRITHYARSL